MNCNKKNYLLLPLLLFYQFPIFVQVTEAVVQKYSVKKLFLEISQNSQ